MLRFVLLPHQSLQRFFVFKNLCLCSFGNGHAEVILTSFEVSRKSPPCLVRNGKFRCIEEELRGTCSLQYQGMQDGILLHRNGG